MRKYRLVLAVALSVATVSVWFTQALAQSSTCAPADNVLPTGQVSPSPDNDPLVPIYCLNLQPQPATRITGANDWVDRFGVKGYARLQDGDMGYRVFDGLGGAARTAHMINGDHWIDDNKVQFGGGAMLRPDRTFMFENDKLVVEGDAAAGKAVYGGDQWVEFVITTSPRPDINPPDAPEQEYAYGRFKGFPTFGCRFQANRGEHVRRLHRVHAVVPADGG